MSPYRRICVVIVACAILLVDAGTGVGQQPMTSERRDLTILAEDVWKVWSSPVHIRRGDLITVGAAVGAAAVSALGDSVIGAWISHNPDAFVLRALAPFRDGWIVPLGHLPTAAYILPLSAATYAAGRLSDNADLANAGLGCAASHLSSVGFRVVAYYTIGRERPARTPDPFRLSFPGSSDWYLHSFTGGHVANAMACGTFLARRYSLGAAEPVLYLYAVAVGLGRMADGWHWASDTVTGALMGYAIGSAIANRHRARAPRDQTSVTAAATTMIPLFRFQIVF